MWFGYEKAWTLVATELPCRVPEGYVATYATPAGAIFEVLVGHDGPRYYKDMELNIRYIPSSRLYVDGRHCLKEGVGIIEFLVGVLREACVEVSVLEGSEVKWDPKLDRCAIPQKKEHWNYGQGPEMIPLTLEDQVLCALIYEVRQLPFNNKGS